MTTSKYISCDALGPFLALIKQALAGMVDGEHFVDMFMEDIILEYPYALPGTLARIDVRAKLMAHFSGYGDILFLDRANDLIVHRTVDPAVVVLEYSSHGHGVRTKAPYNNRYVSVIAIYDRKITHWRNYSNPQGVLSAVGGTEPLNKSMNVGILGSEYQLV